MTDNPKRYDFNQLEVSAEHHIANGDFAKALAIYFFMSDGDPSLDGGYLAVRIAECYRSLGEKYASSYWYGRAIEENPEVRSSCSGEKEKLGDLSIDSFLVSPK